MTDTHGMQGVEETEARQNLVATFSGDKIVRIPCDFQQEQGRLPPPVLWCGARRGSRVTSGDVAWLKIHWNLNDFVYLKVEG